MAIAESAVVEGIGVLFGTIGITVNSLYAVESVSALVVLFYRFLFACPALLIWLLLQRQKRRQRLEPKTWLLMAGIGVVQAVSQLCYFEAIGEIGIALATVITICVAPVLVALLSIVWFREALSLPVLLSLLLSIVGIVLISGIDNAHPGVSQRGSVTALISALSFVLVFLFGRMLTGRVDAVQSSFISVVCATVLLLPFVRETAFDLELPLSMWLRLVYPGVITTALAYWLLMSGMRVVNATVASILTLVDPMVAALLAYVFAGEHWRNRELLGGMLLMLAFVTIAVGSKKVIVADK